jgi:hypothetical protein
MPCRRNPRDASNVSSERPRFFHPAAAVPALQIAAGALGAAGAVGGQSVTCFGSLVVASQDPSAAIAATPTWALWPFRMAREYRRRYPDWPGYGVQGVRASAEVVGQAISTQVSAPS